MNEATTEQIGRKQNERQPASGAPSERQKAYITALAAAAGLKMDASKIEDREKASRVIEHLKLLNGRMGGPRQIGDERDRKVAFGLATKLVYRRHVGQYGGIKSGALFWREVEQLFREYQREQERAIAPPALFTGARAPR